jgi:hypothetical protein
MLDNIFNRFEIKFLTDIEKAKIFEKTVAEYMEADRFSKTTGKSYSVYNIYFDNSSDDIIRHSLSKPYYKEKLRLRTYNLTEGPLFLEIKKKIGNVISKRRVAIARKNLFQNNNFTAQIINKSFTEKQIYREIEYFINFTNVFPKVFIAYDRVAYTGKGKEYFRVTFDTNIRTRRENIFFDSGGEGEALIDNDTCVLEVKHTGAIPLWLTAELSRLRIYKQSFSKYGNEYIKLLTGRTQYEKI